MQAYRVVELAAIGFCLCSCGAQPAPHENTNIEAITGKLVLPKGRGEYLKVRVNNKSGKSICLPKAYFSAASGDVRMWKQHKRVEQNLFEDGAGNKIPISFYVLQSNEILDIPFSVEAMGSLRGEYRYEINIGYEACASVKNGLAHENENRLLITGSSYF